jgi:hypothetical protein
MSDYDNVGLDRCHTRTQIANYRQGTSWASLVRPFNRPLEQFWPRWSSRSGPKSDNFVGTVPHAMTLAMSVPPTRDAHSMATTIPLTEVARATGADYSVLRRALNRFGLIDHQDDGQRVIDARIARFFAHSRQISGYLYPRSIDTPAKLWAAASKLKGPK